MRIVFMGAGEIALPSFQYLIESARDHGVVGVFTQPDKPVGRKQILTAPEIKRLALEAGIPVFQPATFRDNEEALAELESLRPDLVVVMAYGQILPRRVIEAPALACVNLHASLLPRHRGASPVQAAIREGDSQTGITLMKVAPKLDSGDMILRESLSIRPHDTGGTLHDRIAELGPPVLAKGLPLLAGGTFPCEKQDENEVTYSGKLEREDGRLNWSAEAEEIERLIRAYDPWPGTFTEVVLHDEIRKLKVYPGTRAVAMPSEPPGTLSREGSLATIACGNGGLLLEGDLQLEGRKRLPVAEFFRGIDLKSGTVFESK